MELRMKMAIDAPAQGDGPAQPSIFLPMLTKSERHNGSPANVLRGKTKNHTLGAPQNLECRPYGSTQADASTPESGLSVIYEQLFWEIPKLGSQAGM